MTFTRYAPAKINLTLEILGRRPDGYHELVSIMQAVSLHDTLTFAPGEAGELVLHGGSDEAPPTGDNLVLRAARALDEATGGGHGARITLKKRIPVGAGLGGGSSDAATTLRALNDMWGTRLADDALAEVAATIGSDVPFFLTGGTALVEGRGEFTTPLAPPPQLWLVLAKPSASLSTPAVYAEYARGPAPRAPEDSALRRVISGLGTELDAATAREKLISGWCNDLEAAAIRLCPEIGDIRARMREAGAFGTMVCGSGSAVFAVAADENHAYRVMENLEAAWAAVAHTVSLPMPVEESDKEAA
jgi:4-diphosphocytidyl-2-C-methyl-D-erythritol kinase